MAKQELKLLLLKGLGMALEKVGWVAKRVARLALGLEMGLWLEQALELGEEQLLKLGQGVGEEEHLWL